MAHDNAEHVEHDSRMGSRFFLFTAVPAWLISLVVHLVFFMVLLMVFMPEVDRRRQLLTLDDAPDAQEIEELVMEEFEPIDEQVLEFDKPPEQPEDAVLSDEIVESDFQEELAATQMVELSDFAEETMSLSDIMSTQAGVSGNATEGRGKATRTQLLREYGGTGASEAAVVAGVQWIADHQLKDGTWNFDHRRGARKPGSTNFGDYDRATRAATAMALLPFLGSGQTHMEGKYKEQIKAGLAGLIKQMEVRGETGSFHEPQGRMYSHGLATIAVCEAYAMTQDPGLVAPAQFAINYIHESQDPIGGGWRYEFQQPGDTSVVGWQVMALKSGSMGYLQVRNRSIEGAKKFLDSVQTKNGAAYGYETPGDRASLNSVGLLCRMYTGWKKDNPALQQGVANLAKVGPSTGKEANMYFNYYATQVMRQYGGAEWEAWNTKMRDFLIKTQVPPGSGVESGSWYFDENHARHGGRLYNTSLSVLTLEVYYRHLPIYKANATDEEFPL